MLPLLVAWKPHSVSPWLEVFLKYLLGVGQCSVGMLNLSLTSGVPGGGRRVLPGQPGNESWGC